MAFMIFIPTPKHLFVWCVPLLPIHPRPLVFRLSFWRASYTVSAHGCHHWRRKADLSKSWVGRYVTMGWSRWWRLKLTVEACWDHGLLSLLPYLEVFCECSWKTSSWDGDGICEVRKCTAFWPRLAYLDAMRIGGNQVRGGLGSIPIKGLQPSIEAVCLKSLCVFFYTQDWTILKELLKQPPKTFRLEVDKEIWYPLPNVNCDWTRPKSSAEETTKLCFLGLEYVYRLL